MPERHAIIVVLWGRLAQSGDKRPSGRGDASRADRFFALVFP